jgi:MEDS: MEthanogen/methylotroph, DcmR Sensory domain
MAKPTQSRESAVLASKQQDKIFAESITGWLTNQFFAIPGAPDRYPKLPWRRILRARGPVRGVLFITKILFLWPFEMMFVLLRPPALSRVSRKTISPVFKHGEHVCFLYQSDDALQRMLARFVKEGLAMGDQCVCVESDVVQAKLRVDLQSLGIDVEKGLARGSLVFLSGLDTYFESGKFSPQRLLNQLSELMDQSLRAGFTGLRVASLTTTRRLKSN